MENTKRMNELLKEKFDEDYKFKGYSPMMKAISKRKYKSGKTTIQSEMDYINRQDPHFFINDNLVSLNTIKEERDETLPLVDNFIGCIVNKSIKIGDIVPELYYIIGIRALEPFDKSYDSDMCKMSIFIETNMYKGRKGSADLVDDDFYVSISDINELGVKYNIKKFAELTKEDFKDTNYNKDTIKFDSENSPIEIESERER